MRIKTVDLALITFTLELGYAFLETKQQYRECLSPAVSYWRIVTPTETHKDCFCKRSDINYISPNKSAHIKIVKDPLLLAGIIISLN